MATDARRPALQTADDVSLDLARYDCLHAIVLDPAIRAANLAALHTVDPELAAAVAAATLPAHWRPARALDGAPTFRVERPGEPAAWFGGTAAPDTRARGLLEGYEPLGKNPALPCTGAGGEIRALLNRLPAQLALYVFECDIVQLAAVLQLVDVAAPVLERRLILVPPADEAGHLIRLLEREPGLLPPGTILAPTLVEADRMTAVQRVCERVFAESALARQRRLSAVECSEAQRVVGADTAPRLALVAMTLDPAIQTRVRRICAAAEVLGHPVVAASLRTPADAHPLAHVERLANFQPTLSLWVGHEPSVLVVPLAGRHAVWIESAKAVPTVLNPGVKYVAATPMVLRALREAGAANDAAAGWYWAADERLLERDPVVPAASSGSVVVVGDLPAMGADALALTLDSQRSLWDCIRRVVRESWEAELTGWPERVLLAGEKAARYSIRDAALREHFLRLVAEIAIPGETLVRIVAALREAGWSVGVVGAGWRGTTDLDVAVLADDATRLPLDAFETMQEVPRGLIFAGAADPFTPALVELTACGLPAAMHAPAGVDLAAALDGVIDPAHDLQRVATRRQLLECVESFVSPAALRRAERLREQIRRSHTWTSRVRELVALFVPGP